MSAHQPRWVAYARATGSTPDAAWERDGNGAPFFAWIEARLAEFRSERGITWKDGLPQAEFTASVEEYAERVSAEVGA